MSLWSSNFVTCNGIKVHYYRTGGDKPVVVLNHATASYIELGIDSTSSGGKINVRVHIQHDYLDDDTDPISVMDEHLEAILLYVRWATNQQLASSESADPDPESMAVSILVRSQNDAQRLPRRARLP